MGGLDGGGELGEVSVTAADALAAALGVHIENGLAAPEAARRLAQNGPNELRGAPTVTRLAACADAVPGPADLFAAGGSGRGTGRVVGRRPARWSCGLAG